MCKRIQDLARHARDHFAQGVAEGVALFHAALPLECGIDLQEAEIDNAAVFAAQGLGQEKGLLHAVEHGAPAFAAAPQFNVDQMALDRQPGASRHQRNGVDIMRGRHADGVVVVGEHAQQLAVGTLDGGGPAGAQAMGQGQFAPRRPPGILAYVLDVDRIAAVRRGAPRCHASANGRAVHSGIEDVWQAGRRAMPQHGARFVHQRD
ncbi:hypothetical protein D3C72_1585200 [compost metagenome]